MHLLLILACFGQPQDSADPATPTTPTTPTGTGTSTASTTVDPFCEDAPVVTWNNFGQGFVKESCQGCHASTAANRYGAPEEITFDTVELCWEFAGAILATATGDAPTMPPAGGVREDDRQRLAWWLRCAEPGT